MQKMVGRWQPPKGNKLISAALETKAICKEKLEKKPTWDKLRNLFRVQNNILITWKITTALQSTSFTPEEWFIPWVIEVQYESEVMLGSHKRWRKIQRLVTIVHSQKLRHRIIFKKISKWEGSASRSGQNSRWREWEKHSSPWPWAESAYLQTELSNS